MLNDKLLHTQVQLLLPLPTYIISTTPDALADSFVGLRKQALLWLGYMKYEVQVAGSGF